MADRDVQSMVKSTVALPGSWNNKMFSTGSPPPKPARQSIKTKAPFHDNFNPPSRTRIESLRSGGGRAAAMRGLRCAVEAGLGVLVGCGQDFASAAGWCAGHAGDAGTAR